MRLENINSSGWVQVPVANIQGTPWGNNHNNIQGCYVKIDLLYSTLSLENSFNIATHINGSSRQHAYLTADQNLIIINNRSLGNIPQTRNINKKISYIFDFIKRCIQENNLNISLDFTQNASTPTVNLS